MKQWKRDPRASKKQTLPFYPNLEGVYIITNEENEVLYVGRSIQLCRRVSHLTAHQKDKTNKAGFSHIKAGYVRKLQEKGNLLSIRFIETEDSVKIENELIDEYDPQWNE